MKQLEQLDAYARDLASRSVAFMDSHWDEQAGLLAWASGELYEYDAGTHVHLVRETAWYALGLLLRNAAGDRERAIRAITTVLGYQFDTPGLVYHGTWCRAPEEPQPPPEPREWRDYDPNWREFIGTTLILILEEYQSLLPPALIEQIDTALRKAIAGTLARNVPASYTNIALMKAFLLEYCAKRYGEPEWEVIGKKLAADVEKLFSEHNTFEEYNSPTYYAIDLFALALWRAYGTSERLRNAGTMMEAALWHDIALFYHAGLRNSAGPYDRSYGMDMCQYVAGLGMWIWMATGLERAPFPPITEPLEHGWDFCAGAAFALLGAHIPEAAQPHLLNFQGERQATRHIRTNPPRIATAWLHPNVMLGGEDSSSSHRVNSQYHPATIHWRSLNGSIGWMRLRHTVPVDALAEAEQLTIRCSKHAGGELVLIFQICDLHIALDAIQKERWELPNLTIHITTNAEAFAIERQGNLIEARYSVQDAMPMAVISFLLKIELR